MLELRDAVADGHVARAVDGEAAHPAMDPVAAEVAVDLLLDRRRRDRAAGDVDLRPLDAGRAGAQASGRCG